MGIQGAHSSVARFRVFYKTTSGVAIVESRFESRLLREARLEPEARLRRERRSFQVSRRSLNVKTARLSAREGREEVFIPLVKWNGHGPRDLCRSLS